MPHRIQILSPALCATSAWHLTKAELFLQTILQLHINHPSWGCVSTYSAACTSAALFLVCQTCHSYLISMTSHKLWDVDSLEGVIRSSKSEFVGCRPVHIALANCHSPDLSGLHYSLPYSLLCAISAASCSTQLW